MPLVVFSIEESGNIARLLAGEARATTIAPVPAST
jgi:uridylate kinase